VTTDIPWLSALGIVLDIVGAAWIAKALAFSSTRDLMDQASSKWDINNSTLIALELQRLDARCGLAVLVAGFAMQFVSLFFPHGHAWIACTVAVLVVAVTWVYYQRVKKNEAASRAEKVTKYILDTGKIP